MCESRRARRTGVEGLYRKRAGAFTRMAEAIAGPAAGADAMQDGFARAHAHRARFRGFERDAPGDMTRAEQPCETW
ncbi:MAG: hypothetical protein QOI71_1413 [Gaiellales bacterium]|nr:hypothetical protein [Gaiellales bacterium]